MSGIEGPADQPNQNSLGGNAEASFGESVPGPGRPQLPPGTRPNDTGQEREVTAAGHQAPGGYGLLLSELLTGVLWLVSSFLIIFWVCQIFDFEKGTWILIGLWLFSGLAILYPGLDGLVARLVFGLRQPTMVERQRLASIWFAVAGRFGVDAHRYTLWIQESERPTGVAARGHTVAVTSWALYTLPPSHLEAVMAHDLARHLRGHGWLSRLALWYSVPTRLVALAVRALLKLSRTVPAVGCTIVGFLLVAYIGIILVALVFYDSLAAPLLYLTPLFAPLIFIGLSRWNERMADRATADLGYGRRLLEVFYGWQAQHQHESRRMGVAQPDWLAGQPSITERIRALETYLQRR
jgi:Zn-dependent protease with chaperone function